jgi:hypothetical protein
MQPVLASGEDMSAYAWDCCEDPEEELEVFAVLKTEYELAANVQFSLIGLTSFIEKTIASNVPNAEEWTQSVNMQNLRVNVKKSGSEANSSEPFIHLDAIWPKAVKFTNLIKTCYGVDEILKWDANIIDMDIKPLRDDCKTAAYTFQRNKSVMGIEGREFYEKSFGFFHEGKYYRFTSSVPNSDSEPEHEGDLTKRPLFN